MAKPGNPFRDRKDKDERTMNSLETLKREIEKERAVLDEMLVTKGMSEVIEQSQKLDRLIENYLDIAE